MLLSPLVIDPRIEVAEYMDYGDPDGATGFEHRNVLHGYGPERPGVGRHYYQTLIMLGLAG
ncbi:hypothetical protein [Streptomyces sp. RPT161]|uniref:hypothetical protein n=1 Tax=Streptomyces sp. RPT161 TaxID=3015993 RepID=UPI002FCF51F3